MLNFSNIHIFLIASITFFLFINRNFEKKKIDYAIFLLIFLYFTNDSLRYLSNNKYIDLFIFISKDLFFIFLLLYICKKNFNKLLQIIINYKFLIISLFLYTILNFLNSYKMIYFPLGIYDVIFFPVSALILSQVTLNFKFIEKIILFMFLIILFTFSFQLLNLELYINLFLNNVEINKIEILNAKKAYNPDLVNNTKAFISQLSSIFNNAGRFNHFIPIFYLFTLYIYLKSNSKKNLYIVAITLIIVFINSSRFSLIICLLPTLEVIYNKYFNVQNKKKLYFWLAMTFIPLIVISFVFFNMFHKDQFHKKIQTFQPLIIIYHQFYEPLLFSKTSDDKKNETAHSLTGRLILIQKELSTLLIKYDPEINDILIGHGMGVHSMGTKHLVKDYDKIYKFENSFTILIYEIGVIGFIFVIIFIFYFISFFKRELTNLSEENKKKIYKSILIIPIILLFTGFQFYRDFALQFFYFLLLSMMVKDLTTNNRN